jgi:hypothetical protein
MLCPLTNKSSRLQMHAGHSILKSIIWWRVDTF